MPASWLSIGVIASVMAGIIWAFGMYERLVRSKKRVDAAWAAIALQLQLRAGLVPHLVEMVRGYTEHERGIFEEVARAHGAMQQVGGAAQAADANNMLSQALVRLFAVAERYPQLCACADFARLRNDLADVEDRITLARRFYNRNVLDYNTKLDTNPDALIAHQTQLAPAEFFGVHQDARGDSRLDFAEPAA